MAESEKKAEHGAQDSPRNAEQYGEDAPCGIFAGDEQLCHSSDHETDEEDPEDVEVVMMQVDEEVSHETGAPELDDAISTGSMWTSTSTISGFTVRMVSFTA